MTEAEPRSRNPEDIEMIFVPARKKVHFKAGKKLKEVLNKSME
jgi:integration host factor subunit beta